MYLELERKQHSACSFYYILSDYIGHDEDVYALYCTPYIVWKIRTNQYYDRHSTGTYLYSVQRWWVLIFQIS